MLIPSVTPWKKLDEQIVYKNYRTIIQKKYQLPNGKVAAFEIVSGTKIATILALTKENNVVLIKQFRPGPEEIFLELPGGGIESEENPLKSAQRELLEETGYNGEFTFITKNIDFAYANTIRYNFVAIHCEKIQEQRLDENEFIEVVETPLRKFREYLRRGKIINIQTAYLCLDYLGLL